MATTSRARRLRGLREVQPYSSGAGWRRYQERVIARHGRGQYTILLREDPMTRLSGLRGLGAGPSGPQLLQAGGAAAATAITSSSASIAAATGIGAAAVPIIGAAIGAVIGVLAGLWAAHQARVKGAKTENQVLNSAVSTFYQAMQQIFQAANGGQITAAQASQLVQQQYQTFWAQMCPYTQGPGRADTSNCGQSCGGPTNLQSPCTGLPNGHVCNKQCTATCCVGCQDILPVMQQAMAVFASPTGGSVQLCSVSSSKYGLSAGGGGSVTYTPPAASSVAGVTNALESGSLTSSVFGIPLWALLGGGAAAIWAMNR